MSIVDYVTCTTEKYIAQMPKERRKKYGQFFTSKETARFMAGLLMIPDKKEITILDPGAGTGILSAALVERLQVFESVQEITLVCYENDPNVLGLLYSNLEWMAKHSDKRMKYQVIEANYILNQMEDYNSMLGAASSPYKFDLIIGNPPYMKISRDAPEALAMADVCCGAPNLYFLFAAMSLFDLRENGEMVYIVPRSWTAGAYFKQFRKKLFKEGKIEHIHLFVKRNKVFNEESVLQETIIVKIKKTEEQPDKIQITTSDSSVDFSTATRFEAPHSAVVRKHKDFYVYLVTNDREMETLLCLEKWKDTLPSIGLKMKTGLTVDFRNRDALRSVSEENAVPLFYAQHIQGGKVIFPIGKENEYIVTEQRGLLQENTNYLFVKRFTAKEEHRRLQCGVYLARKYPGYKKISTQNKINFICGLNGLSECVVYGLYVLFNSTIYDGYYRILNGSTQVNSTEVNALPVPSMKVIEEMGKNLIQARDMSETSCDRILRRYL